MPTQAPKTLAALRDAEARCTRCPLYKSATQAVSGEGPRRARFMLVGEQPGDKEDLAGVVNEAIDGNKYSPPWSLQSCAGP